MRLATTIQQSYDWHELIARSKFMVDKCNIYKHFKRTSKHKYGKLPEKEVETAPTSEMYINLIGPYTDKHTHQTYPSSDDIY